MPVQLNCVCARACVRACVCVLKFINVKKKDKNHISLLIYKCLSSGDNTLLSVNIEDNYSAHIEYANLLVVYISEC